LYCLLLCRLIFLYLLLTVSSELRSFRSFPSRRSSDLDRTGPGIALRGVVVVQIALIRDASGDAAPTLGPRRPRRPELTQSEPRPDRKSTRLNSSHVKISYAVFCLKKKKQS